MSEEMFNELAQTVIDGEPEDAEELAKQALEQGVDALACINQGLMPGIQKVGELFSTGDYFLPELIIAAIKDVNADIVGASALLTTTMLQQKKLVEALETAGLRDKVKVLVGGAPVTESFAKEIGADGYAEDAISAVDIAYRLMDAPA